MNKIPRTSLTLMIAALAMTMMAAPALADTSKKSKKSAAHSSAAVAAEAIGDVPDVGAAPMAGHHDQKPGPAWKTIGGTVKQIKGDMYTVEDYEGNQVQLYVGQETKKVRGNKKVGDTVRAGDPICEVTTDKVNMEVEAPESGTLISPLYPAGATVPVTEIIAYLLRPGETRPTELPTVSSVFSPPLHAMERGLGGEDLA